MEKPGKKLKKTLLILGVTGAVYAGFKYLLPLVIPFLIAYLFALALRPSAIWVEKRCRFRLRGKEYHPPLAVIGGVEILILMSVSGVLLYAGCKRLCMEAQLFFDNLPALISRLDRWLTGCCFTVERSFHLPKGRMVLAARDMIRSGGQALKSTAMPLLMVNSVTAVKALVNVSVVAVILFIATVLTMQEMDDIRRKRDSSIFRREYALLGNRLVNVGSAWLKTQGSIMVITMIICTAGLFFLGNPYSILLGIGIGLLDALPIFGTGTLLIPWAVFCLFNKNWVYGAGLLFLYFLCYLIREFMEAKIMGNKVGLTPLETLISMYTGLKLFGLLGFILGPIGLLVIEDAVEFYDAGDKESPGL